jgi:16S rRNA (guanine966-N2)-methyltransferase
MPRIIAGEFRSRRLITPADDPSTRPYTDRVKESVFNLLRGWFEDANVLDLFAGVGTMGLEAVSRGAKRVLMVEQNRGVYKMLEQNIATLKCEDRAEAMQGDALSRVAILRAPKPVDVVFIDPPYEMMKRPESRRRVLSQIERCRDVMGDAGFVVLRSPVGPSEDLPLDVEGFIGPEAHRHGKDMWVLLYEPEARNQQQ